MKKIQKILFLKKYNSQEITYHDNPKNKKLSEFEKKCKDIRNLIDFNNTQNNNEEKRRGQIDLYLNNYIEFLFK